MDPYHKLVLDTNRHHLESIKNGQLKKINVADFWRIIVTEFIPTYGGVNDRDFDQVAKLVTDTYREYDAWLLVLERNGILPENIKVLEDYRPFHALTVKGAAVHKYVETLPGTANKDLLRVARAEFFQGGYNPNLTDPKQLTQMILDVYQRYDEFLISNPKKKAA